MAVAIQREAFGDCFDEAIPLLRRHWQEIAHYPDIPLDPDVAKYHALDDADALRVFTARLDGKLVGYAVFFVNRNLHYRSSVQAVQDVIYVDPDHRRSTIGLKLLRYCEDALRMEGVQAIYHHVKAAHPALGKIVERMGYEIVDVIYARRLDAKREGKRVEIFHEPAEV